MGDGLNWTQSSILNAGDREVRDLIVIVYNLFRGKKKGHEWPRLMIISVSKAENKKMAQICCL